MSLTSPGIQSILDTKRATETARESNDTVRAQYVDAHPTRLAFFAAVAMQDPEGAAAELERAVTELGAKGALINGFTNICDHDTGRYLDDPVNLRQRRLVRSNNKATVPPRCSYLEHRDSGLLHPQSSTGGVADHDALAAAGVEGINFQLSMSIALLERLAHEVASGRLVPPPHHQRQARRRARHPGRSQHEPCRWQDRCHPLSTVVLEPARVDTTKALHPGIVIDPTNIPTRSSDKRATKFGTTASRSRSWIVAVGSNSRSRRSTKRAVGPST